MLADPVVRLLAERDVTSTVEAAWRDLADRAAEPNPCNEPDVLLPALRHLADGDRARLLVVTRGQQIDALLPVVPVRRWRGKAPVPALTSWTHPYQLLGTPLVDHRRAPEALAALLRAPWAARGAAMLLEIEDLGDSGPVAAALEEAVAAVGGRFLRWETHQRAVLEQSGDEAGPGRLAGRHKRVRRSRRALERSEGPLTLVDRAADEEAVERFMALEAAGWKGRLGTALACDPADAAFFREVCARFRAAGRLELRALELPTGPVAMQTALRAGDGVFHFKVTYDETYRDYSPGVQLLVDYADRFPEESIGFRDSCTAADNVTESQVWPGRRSMATVIVPFASLASRATVRALGAARESRARAV
ncbi:MAG: Acetyltransferase involved in cellulose biosynthesis, CelD/BcsL family [Friedmanniella sp.]|nr:Acetyltransferase involved in cellulose biosynthesis, CelD/BcsL family [Friedmanniella sp.]